MNTNLPNFLTSLLSRSLEFSLNFIDDILCLLLSHLGIHLAWLQLCGYGLIAGKLIYWLVKLSRDRTPETDFVNCFLLKKLSIYKNRLIAKESLV